MCKKKEVKIEKLNKQIIKCTSVSPPYWLTTKVKVLIVISNVDFLFSFIHKQLKPPARKKWNEKMKRKYRDENENEKNENNWYFIDRNGL